MTKPSPIAVFLYNRPTYAQSILASLEKCHRVEECRIVIFSDGANSDEHVQGVEATRKIAEKWALANKAELVKQPKNLGMASSEIQGVGELCRIYGKVITIEDDHILNNYYLDFMLQGLDFYQNAEKVAHIIGYFYPIRAKQQFDAYLLPLMIARGCWATWQRVWSKVDWWPENARQELASPELSRKFDLDGAYPYTRMLIDRFENKNNSYSIFLWWHIFTTGKLVVYPRQSMAWVGGFDGTGVHCGDKLLIQTPLEKVMKFKFNGKIRFPEKIEPDNELMERVKRFLIEKRGPPNLLERVRRKVYRTITGDNRPFTV